MRSGRQCTCAFTSSESTPSVYLHAGTCTANLKRRSPPCYLSALTILLSFYSYAIVNSLKYVLHIATSLRCIFRAVVCNLLCRRYGATLATLSDEYARPREDHVIVLLELRASGGCARALNSLFNNHRFPPSRCVLLLTMAAIFHWRKFN